MGHSEGTATVRRAEGKSKALRHKGQEAGREKSVMETKQEKGPGGSGDGGRELVKCDLCSLDLATGHPWRLLAESGRGPHQSASLGPISRCWLSARGHPMTQVRHNRSQRVPDQASEDRSAGPSSSSPQFPQRDGRRYVRSLPSPGQATRGSSWHTASHINA